jgi:DNA-binding winged helix-turn-helix (wHTH) protein/TolB-like protein
VPPGTTRRVRFGPFTADLDRGELWRDGVPVPLQDLPFRLLASLVERPGEVVSRAELTTRLWGSDTFVDATAGLNTAIAKLRDALEDAAERPAYVETLPKRGYRFVSPVERVKPDAQSAPAVAEVMSAADPAADPAAASPKADAAPSGRRRWWLAAAAIVAAVALAAWAAYPRWSDARNVRVAVVLFDNETDRAELTAFAQALTDATVTSLTAEPRLAVIGNAAVLRTSRPFRDVALIRDTLGAQFIIVGQVQWRDGAVLVRTHLIRGWDQAHVWLEAFPRGSSSEADYQARVSGAVRGAVMAQLR